MRLKRYLNDTKKIPNDPNRGQEAEVRLEFKVDDKDKLFEIEKLLRELGVSFDTGYDFGEKRRDWEMDWSLRGLVKVIFIRFTKDDPKNRYTRESVAKIFESKGFFVAAEKIVGT